MSTSSAQPSAANEIPAATPSTLYRDPVSLSSHVRGTLLDSGWSSYAGDSRGGNRDTGSMGSWTLINPVCRTDLHHGAAITIAIRRDRTLPTGLARLVEMGMVPLVASEIVNQFSSVTQPSAARLIAHGVAPVVAVELAAQASGTRNIDRLIALGIAPELAREVVN